MNMKEKERIRGCSRTNYKSNVYSQSNTTPETTNSQPTGPTVEEVDE